MKAASGRGHSAILVNVLLNDNNRMDIIDIIIIDYLSHVFFVHF